MARKAKDDIPAAVDKSISAKDLKRIVAEASKHKKTAAEWSGMHGKTVANAVEQYGINKTAFTFCRRLNDMEDQGRQAVLRSMIEYSNKLGFFDQFDAFDDLHAMLDDIRERAPPPGPERKTGDDLSSLQ